VGREDNFFILGGDSLHMTRIASRLRRQFGVEISMEDFFEEPTVAGIAKLLGDAVRPEQNDL
jgi:acyl carrier protein